MADGSDPPPGAYPFLEPALLMTVAVHDLERHTQSMMDALTAAIQAKISAMTKGGRRRGGGPHSSASPPPALRSAEQGRCAPAGAAHTSSRSPDAPPPPRPAPGAVPAVARGTLFTDLLTAASPDLTPCSSVQVACADVAALKALSDLATKTPAAFFDAATLGEVDVREFSAQIRMVAKAAAA